MASIERRRPSAPFTPSTSQGPRSWSYEWDPTTAHGTAIRLAIRSIFPIFAVTERMTSIEYAQLAGNQQFDAGLSLCPHQGERRRQRANSRPPMEIWR
jgi:hypothetical protein